MSENLKELTFFQSDWGDDEMREHKLELLSANHRLEYVRHERIPNKHKYRMFFKEADK